MRAKVLSGMTALVSFGLPSAPHILPPMRIIAGIEASTITSLGACRFVMPLSLLTYERRGPRAMSAAISSAIA